MAVDPKYVEEVKDEKIDFESVLEDFGIEASYQNDNSNGMDLDDYTVTTLKDMYPGDICNGRAVVSDIYTVEFKDKKTGEVTVNHKIDLVLLDDTYPEEMEASVFPVNLNSDNIDFKKGLIKDVSSRSGLYALAMGLMDLKAPGISKSFNFLKIVGVKKLQKQASLYKDLTVEVKEKSFKKDGEEHFYNAFKITEGEEKD